MFEGKVVRISHERGLLISFEGSSPALGSTIVDTSGVVLGRVETVLGNINEPLVHLHPLKSGVIANDCIGKTVKIRARTKDNSRSSFKKKGEWKRGGDRKSPQKRGRNSQRRDDSKRQKKPFKKHIKAKSNKHFKDRNLKNVFKKKDD